MASGHATSSLGPQAAAGRRPRGAAARPGRSRVRSRAPVCTPAGVPSAAGGALSALDPAANRPGGAPRTPHSGAPCPPPPAAAPWPPGSLAAAAGARAGPAASSSGRAAGRTCHLQRARRVQGAERVAGAQAGPLHHVVVRAAEEPVLAQRELVAGDELAAAGHAAEALDVVDLGAGAHHEVVLAEADAALGALDPVQPARAGPGRGEAQGSGHAGGHGPV